MDWTKTPPKYAEYYWAVPKDRDSMLDGPPEVVKVYWQGGGPFTIYRPGDDKGYKVEDFTWFSDDMIPYLPDDPDDPERELR